METYQSEKAKLNEWILQKNSEYIEKIRQRSKEGTPKGHDSELSYEHAQDVKEYNRRFDALKKKYGKDITVQESDSSKKSERIYM